MSNVLFVCVLGEGGGGGCGGDGPVFVCLFVCLFVCFLDSTKSDRTVCKRFPLFLFHPFHSFILLLPHKTHLHFTTNLKKILAILDSK